MTLKEYVILKSSQVDKNNPHGLEIHLALLRFEHVINAITKDDRWKEPVWDALLDLWSSNSPEKHVRLVVNLLKRESTTNDEYRP